MDNFTHSLAGWVIGQAGLKTRTRKGLAALILGANMPDIDVFFGWVAWQPLATHRGFTHGIGGIALLPPLLAGLLWLLDRWQLRRGATFRSGLPMRIGWLVALSYAGALTHPLLDLQNTYAVQLLAPFSPTWFHADSLFIIDVWLWSGIAFALWLSRRRERGGGRWRAPAQIALVAALGYIGGNLLLSTEAEASARRAALAAGERPDLVIAGQEPVRFWRRTLLVRSGARYGYGVYDPLGAPSLTPPASYTPDNMADPLARRAATATPAIRRFLYWSIAPTATIRRGRCAATVDFSDARFAGTPTRRNFVRSVTLPVAGPGCPR
jgi:inner membrane protein